MFGILYMVEKVVCLVEKYFVNYKFFNEVVVFLYLVLGFFYIISLMVNNICLK